MKAIIKNVLIQGAFYTINKSLLTKLGLQNTMILTELIDKYYYFEGRNELTIINGEEYFFETADNIKKNTTLSYSQQKKCLEFLENKKLIKIIKKGLPAKLYFSLNVNNIFNILKTTIKENSIQVFKKVKNLNSIKSKTCFEESSILYNNNIPIKNRRIKTEEKANFENKFSNGSLDNKNLIDIKKEQLTDEQNNYFKYAKSFNEMLINKYSEFNINNNQNLLKAKFKGWCEPIKKMIQIDKRTHDDFILLWNYLKEEQVSENGFAWFKNIQSMEKLRKQFDKLTIEAKAKLKSKTKEKNKTTYKADFIIETMKMAGHSEDSINNYIVNLK